MKTRFLAIIAVAFALVLAPAQVVQAQPGITIGAGLGAVLGERRELPDDVDDLNHKLAFVSLRLPMMPLEIRAEGLWPDDPFDTGARAYIASAVLALPLGIVTPYAQAGWGDYNFGDPERSKWSAGVGARLNLGALGIFAEATRYNRFNADLISAGLTLSTGR